MEEELYVDEEGCDDCIYKYWMESAGFFTGRSTSRSGFACEKTGGHAIVRCKSYTPDEQEN